MDSWLPPSGTQAGGYTGYAQIHIEAGGPPPRSSTNVYATSDHNP